jgi:hypothetical protein
MKELLGYFLIVQAILTTVIVYSIERLSDSIKQSIGFLKSESGTLGSGAGMPAFVWIAIFIVVCIGLYLISKKNIQ